jgi:hypothetical protein
MTLPIMARASRQDYAQTQDALQETYTHGAAAAHNKYKALLTQRAQVRLFVTVLGIVAVVLALPLLRVLVLLRVVMLMILE